MTFNPEDLRGEDLLVTNARIYPHADATECVDSMVVKNGRIVAIGNGVATSATDGELPVLDATGRVILPGLIDAHTHVEFSAMARSGWVDIHNLSPAEVLERIRAAVAAVSGTDDWVIAQATFLQPLPSRAEVDAISADVPVLVRESMHRYQANTEALRRAGLADALGKTPSGVIIHVDEAGSPTGLVEEGFHLFPIPAYSVEELEALLHHEMTHSFARSGVTAIYEIPATWEGVEAYKNLANRAALPARISLNPVLAPGLSPLLADLSEWDRDRFGDGEDSDLIASGAVKIFIDGDNELSFDSERFSRSPREWGAVTRTLGQLVNELVWATRNDVQVWVHAIGDLAQEFVLQAVEDARAIAGLPRRNTRLEHAANLQLDDAFVERLRALEVIPVPTANFMSTDDGTGYYGYRTLLDAGLEPPGNSDTGGAIKQAPNPWFGIAHLVKRTNMAGIAIAPEERISGFEGARTYTDYSARAAGLEHVFGRLQPGFAADFAVYDTDPRTLDPEAMEQVEADMTFVGGRKTWDKERATSI